MRHAPGAALAMHGIGVAIARLAAVLVVITVVTTQPLHAESGPDRPRLRVLDRRMSPMVQAGRDQSPSFRALVERLETTDVVVYVECTRLRRHLDGDLTFVSAAGGLRYLMVRLAWDLTLSRKIATLGHELQHVLEVAARPDIVSAQTMAVAYERFGFTRNRGVDRVDFDTVAAIDTGIAIWRELWRRSDGD
jgi:hypothetical protein